MCGVISISGKTPGDIYKCELLMLEVPRLIDRPWGIARARLDAPTLLQPPPRTARPILGHIRTQPLVGLDPHGLRLDSGLGIGTIRHPVTLFLAKGTRVIPPTYMRRRLGSFVYRAEMLARHACGRRARGAIASPAG